MIKKTITSTIGRFFKSESQIIFFSKLHKLIIKITNGKIGTNLLGVPILILTTTSSKTGKQYSNPLAYIKYQDGYVCIASFGGSDKHPVWFKNIEKNSNVSININGKTSSYTATIIYEDPLREKLWKELINIYSGFKEYQEKTTRKLPIIYFKLSGN